MLTPEQELRKDVCDAWDLVSSIQNRLYKAARSDLAKMLADSRFALAVVSAHLVEQAKAEDPSQEAV